MPWRFFCLSSCRLSAYARGFGGQVGGMTALFGFGGFKNLNPLADRLGQYIKNLGFSRFGRGLLGNGVYVSGYR